MYNIFYQVYFFNNTKYKKYIIYNVYRVYTL